MRTTGHGIAAGVGKLGAFIGVFVVPQLENRFGLRGMLTVAGGGCPGLRTDESAPGAGATDA